MPPPFYPQIPATTILTCVCVCVFPKQPIDVWVIPCIQLCKINTRIKHQMTEIYCARRDPTFLHFCHYVCLSFSVIRRFSVSALSIPLFDFFLSLSYFSYPFSLSRLCSLFLSVSFSPLHCFLKSRRVCAADSQLLLALSPNQFVFMMDRHTDRLLLYLYGTQGGYDKRGEGERRGEERPEEKP